MSNTLRDRFDPEHARARELAAAKVGEPLDPEDAGWLETHLAWCAPCRAVAGEYETQRLELRALRLNDAQPPRDLWARTAAALEVEQTRKGVRTERAAPGTTPAVRGRTSFPLGALTGVAATMFVVGVTLLGGREAPLVPTFDPSTSVQTSGAGPAVTPLAVPERAFNVITVADGSVAIVNFGVDSVCPKDIDPDCAQMRQSSRHRVDVDGRETVHEAVMNATNSHVVIVQHGSTDRPSSRVVVVPVIPRADPSPTLASLDPAVTPIPSPDPVDPSESPVDPASATPGTSPEETTDPPPSEDPAPSDPTPATSQEPITSASPSTEPAPSDEPSSAPASLDVTAAPEDGPVVIAADVIVVGRTAAYSDDGQAFAFTARPTDGSHGPDVYVWRVGTDEALPVTSDHASVFSSWVGGRLLISRSDPDGDPLVAARGEVPMSLLLDPETREETVVSSEPMFRPVVDPTERAVVWWDGAIETGADGFGWQPRSGRLVLGTWTDPDAAGGASDRPEPEEDVLASGPIPDWDARWDTTGTRLAVWIADREDPTTGRLSLYSIDPTTGRIDASEPLLEDEPALPGFSLDNGRLVWAAAAEGDRTRVEVLAWDGSDVGQVELAPAQDPVIIVR